MQHFILKTVKLKFLFLFSAVSNHNRSFIPNDAAMTVNVDVTFSPASLTFTSCCKLYSKQCVKLQIIYNKYSI